MSTKDQAVVAELWGETAKCREDAPYRGWLDSPIVLEEYVQPKQTGFRSKNWLVGLIEELKIDPVARWISLGCGSAGVEIYVSSLGLSRGPFLACDISQGALDAAARAAKTQAVTNFDFEVVDLNALRLKKGYYDVVLMNMSLHHVENLESTLGQIAGALKPGGLLLLNEFIGPSRFQFTDLQLEMVRKALAALPEELRRDLTTGEAKTEYVRLPVAHWLVADPSEAVRSSEMLVILDSDFELILRRDYGGTILGLALEHIIHNFHSDNVGHVTAIKLLSLMEEQLICGGVIPSDYAVLALRKRTQAKRGNWLQRLTGTR